MNLPGGGSQKCFQWYVWASYAPHTTAAKKPRTLSWCPSSHKVWWLFVAASDLQAGEIYFWEEPWCHVHPGPCTPRKRKFTHPPRYPRGSMCPGNVMLKPSAVFSPDANNCNRRRDKKKCHPTEEIFVIRRSSNVKAYDFSMLCSYDFGKTSFSWRDISRVFEPAHCLHDISLNWRWHLDRFYEGFFFVPKRLGKALVSSGKI